MLHTRFKAVYLQVVCSFLRNCIQPFIRRAALKRNPNLDKRGPEAWSYRNNCGTKSARYARQFRHTCPSSDGVNVVAYLMLRQRLMKRFRRGVETVCLPAGDIKDLQLLVRRAGIG